MYFGYNLVLTVFVLVFFITVLFYQKLCIHTLFVSDISSCNLFLLSHMYKTFY